MEPQAGIHSRPVRIPHPGQQAASARGDLGFNEIRDPFMSIMLPLGTVTTSLLGNYATVLIFVLVGFVFAGIALGVAKILRPSNPSPAKMTTYECGELPTGRHGSASTSASTSSRCSSSSSTSK